MISTYWLRSQASELVYISQSSQVQVFLPPNVRALQRSTVIRHLIMASFSDFAPIPSICSSHRYIYIFGDPGNANGVRRYETVVPEPRDLCSHRVVMMSNGEADNILAKTKRIIDATVCSQRRRIVMMSSQTMRS